jgi:GTPase
VHAEQQGPKRVGRACRDQISALKNELESVRKHRQAYRKRRKSSNASVVALVGYTNAGKSTLINALTHAHVLAEDTLFATLGAHALAVVTA